ncbi:DNA-binding domain-containing protein [Terracidiphilus sp.]|uniref:HvfC/BufC N-terminal domain-containing protein n=1 Tax=Terracidiphilus sp. TaxID=1964191 RepID=UPI003C15327F
MNLLEIQRRMAEDVRRPLTPDFEMQQETESGASTKELAASYIAPNALLTSFERLEIYNRQYWFRLIDAVSDDFPALNAMLGAKRFNSLVPAYIRENPSTSWTLRDLSSKLPEWLTRHPEFTGKRHLLAIDIARLEWAYVEAYDRKKIAPLGAEDIQELGPDARIALQPHIQLLELRYPVDELVMAVHRAAPETDIVSNAAMAKKQRNRIPLPPMRRTPIFLAVHRFDDQVYYRRVECEAYRMLSALRNGSSISDAIEIAFSGSDFAEAHLAMKVQEYFTHAAQLGWFCRALELQS